MAREIRPLSPRRDGFTAVLDPLAQRFGGRLVRDAERCVAYAADESPVEGVVPAGVVLAESEAEVADVLRFASAHGIPVTARGAGTCQSGGVIPEENGLVLALDRMAKIVDVSPGDLTATVQPGVILGEFQRAAEGMGLFYPPDPASLEMCTLGGNVAENAGGPRCLKYGVTKDYVIGLRVVTAAGETLELGRRTAKGVVGLDLAGLLVGSEGTLAIVTEITVKLRPKPAFQRTLLCLFNSSQEAVAAVAAVTAAGILPCAMEFADAASLGAVRARAQVRIPASARAVVIAELDGFEESCERELMLAADIFSARGATEVLVAKDSAERRDLWQTRRLISPALKEAHKFWFNEDVAVPRSRVAEMTAEVERLAAELNLTMAAFGHAGDGNLHINVYYDDPAEQPRVKRAYEGVLRACLRLGGTISGEHGIGLAKKPYVAWEQAPAVIQMQREIKRLWDPKNILNPGKCFPEPGGPG